ncbi:MAG: hypothetical protein KJ592_00810 [Nanoarchaeota archaeon]|nr:hypothetical protein [Nanoarchaeota archaeon]
MDEEIMWGHYQPCDWKFVSNKGIEESLENFDFCGFVFRSIYDSSIGGLRNIGKLEVEEMARKRGADVIARLSSKGYQRVSIKGRYFLMKRR